MDVEDGLGREPQSGAGVAMVQQVGVELFETFGAQTPQRNVADMGDHVKTYHPLVSVEGAGFEVESLRPEPVAGDEPSDGQL